MRSLSAAPNICANSSGCAQAMCGQQYFFVFNDPTAICFRPAREIDPVYGDTLYEVRQKGVVFLPTGQQ